MRIEAAEFAVKDLPRKSQHASDFDDALHGLQLGSQRIAGRKLSRERRTRQRTRKRIGVALSAAKRYVRRLHQLKSVIECQQLLQP